MLKFKRQRDSFMGHAYTSYSLWKQKSYIFQIQISNIKKVVLLGHNFGGKFFVIQSLISGLVMVFPRKKKIEALFLYKTGEDPQLIILYWKKKKSTLHVFGQNIKIQKRLKRKSEELHKCL